MFQTMKLGMYKTTFNILTFNIISCVFFIVIELVTYIFINNNRQIEPCTSDEPSPAKCQKITAVGTSYDISDVDHNSSDTIKYKILLDTQTFPRNHHFPQQQFGKTPEGKPHMHSFSLKWLDEFQSQGLVYSSKDDGAYCKYCKLFPGGERGALVKVPFRRWKNAKGEFEAHFQNKLKDKTKGCRGYKSHATALVRAAEFIKQVEGEAQPVHQLLDERAHAQVLKNRQIIKSIGKSVHYLAKQNLSLRGHRDDSKYYDTVGVNPGNFQELLKFRADAGDTCLKLHFEEGHKNATYRSKTIQNQIVKILGDQVLDGIIANVKKAKYFAISADEATDSGKQTQLTMVLRYVDENGKCLKLHTSISTFCKVYL